jgi:hypothetical protein
MYACDYENKYRQQQTTVTSNLYICIRLNNDKAEVVHGSESQNCIHKKLKED